MRRPEARARRRIEDALGTRTRKNARRPPPAAAWTRQSGGASRARHSSRGLAPHADHRASGSKDEWRWPPCCCCLRRRRRRPPCCWALIEHNIGARRPAATPGRHHSPGLMIATHRRVDGCCSRMRGLFTHEAGAASGPLVVAVNSLVLVVGGEWLVGALHSGS